MAPAPASGTAANDTATDESSANNGAASTDQQAATTGKSDRTAMSSETGGTNGTDATATDKSTTAAIDRSKLNKVETSTISADDFIGTTVYGADDKKIGEIGDVVLNKDGKIDAVVVDVGGFLGVGEKQVAVGMDNLAFLADESGNKYLYTEFTEDQLKAQPAYDKNSYAQSRDKMRMSVQ
jgi:hypothetical protein